MNYKSTTFGTLRTALVVLFTFMSVIAVKAQCVPQTAPAAPTLIPMGSSSSDGCGCSVPSPIQFPNADANTIIHDGDIDYIRLNIAYAGADELFIRIVCPNNQSAIILNCNSHDDPEEDIVPSCGSNLIPANGYGWQGSTATPFYDYYNFGQPSDDAYASSCTLSMDDYDGSGWDYFWSNQATEHIYDLGNFDDDNTFNKSISDDQNDTTYYLPEQSLDSLTGCPLSGNWYIEIINANAEYGVGYLFDWEIVLSDNMATPIQGETHSETVCQGGTITLEAGCTPPITSTNTNTTLSNAPLSLDFSTIDLGGDTWHSHSHTIGGETYYGPENQEVDAYPAYVTALSDFPTRSKVFPAGGKVKLGIDGQTGSMTSAPRDLSNPFSVLVRAKGWGTEPTSSSTPKKTRVNVVVDKGQPAEQIKFFDTDPAYHWPGTDAYRDYSLLFDGASVASTITIETVNNGSGYDTRAFLDYVGTKSVNCAYVWGCEGCNWGTDSTNSSITVSPSTTTTYTVTVTPAGGCARVDTVTVFVPQELALSENHTAITCHGGTATITASASNGTPGYMWKIDSEAYSAEATATSHDFTNVTAGQHTLWVKDHCGAEKSVTVNLSEPQELALSENHTAITCHGGTATITASASGGTEPYTYSIFFFFPFSLITISSFSLIPSISFNFEISISFLRMVSNKV